MKRAPRIAVCAAVALAATSVWTDASAHPGRPGGTSALSAAHHQSGHHPRGHHQAEVEDDGSGRVLLALGRLDRRLAGALRHRLASLSDRDRAALRRNRASDQSAVETVATAYSQSPTGRHLHTARGLLHSFHAERYVRAAAILRRSGRTAASIVDLSTRVLPGSADAADLATASGLLTDAGAHRFTARTQPAAMRAARQEVARARVLVDHVRADLPTG
jgi:hypothetical protein